MSWLLGCVDYERMFKHHLLNDGTNLWCLKTQRYQHFSPNSPYKKGAILKNKKYYKL